MRSPFPGRGADEVAAPSPEDLRPTRPWPQPRGTAPAEGGVGTLTLIALPAARVALGEVELGSTPLRLQQLPSGRRRLVVTGPDDVPRVLTIDVVGGEHQELQVPLRRLLPEALGATP